MAQAMGGRVKARDNAMDPHIPALPMQQLKAIFAPFRATALSRQLVYYTRGRILESENSSGIVGR
jgi:hypothetical protein